MSIEEREGETNIPNRLAQEEMAPLAGGDVRTGGDGDSTIVLGKGL
jgi:hypothetical protein